MESSRVVRYVEDCPAPDCAVFLPNADFCWYATCSHQALRCCRAPRAGSKIRVPTVERPHACGSQSASPRETCVKRASRKSSRTRHQHAVCSCTSVTSITEVIGLLKRNL